MQSLRSVSLLLPAARAASAEDVASAPNWRAVCELPEQAPAGMAVDAGRAALEAADVAPADVGWVVHCGSGYQASMGSPVHHQIQHGIIGNHGNAIEVRQYCAGGLTSWVLADRLAQSESAVMCTGADNWSWGDRFATSRYIGGEPFSDVAHAALVSENGGFAQILGSGNASCPGQAHAWQTREAFWEHANMADFRQTFSEVALSKKASAVRESHQMLTRAVTTALRNARLSPQYVTHFVPHSSHSGEPYRCVARAVGLPWDESLHDNNLGNGYLGVSCQAAGLVELAKTDNLQEDSIVLLLAAEYQLMSATAVLLRIARRPRVSVDGLVHTAA